MENQTMLSELDLVKRAADRGMNYAEYRTLVQNLAKDGQTTGVVQSEANINYTQLNDRRMSRWDKTLKLTNEVQEQIARMEANLLFLVLTESWCGDASPSLPVMNKIAELNPNIEFKIILRDENPELMDAFLTNGARSIPKLIILDKTKNQIFVRAIV